MSIPLPRSGVSYSPMLEWELVRQWHHISPAEWNEMQGDEQAKYIAVYRVHHQIEGVLAKKQADDAKRSRRKYGGK